MNQRREKVSQAQWKEHMTIPVTNSGRASSRPDNKDHLFKVETQQMNLKAERL